MVAKINHKRYQQLSCLSAMFVSLFMLWFMLRPSTPSDDDIRSAILLLRSPIPPPLESGTWSIPDELFNVESHMHSQVREALKIIDKARPEQFPLLAQSFGDEHYSYSIISAAWMNISVGLALQFSIEQQCSKLVRCRGYKSRDSPSGPVQPPSWGRLLHTIGFDQWYAQQKGRSLEEIQREYARWYREQEGAAGFINDEQRREILGE